MNVTLRQLKFSSLFHNVGPEAILLGPRFIRIKFIHFPGTTPLGI
jgi:hypothetical protein